MTNTLANAAALNALLPTLTVDARAVVEAMVKSETVKGALEAFAVLVSERSVSEWVYMPAKYHGKCACCGSKLVPGQSIVWSKAHKMALGASCYHAQTRTARRTGKLVTRAMGSDSRGNTFCK